MADADFASLYRPWWDALPAFFAAMQPAAAAPPAAPGADGGDDSVAFVKQAVELTSTALPRLFETWLPLLQQGGPSSLTDGLRALATSSEDNLRHLGEAWLGGDRSAWQALLGAPLALASNPITVGAERTFGAFADALGMRPMRDLQDALQRLAGAESERRSALTAYLGMLAQAWGQGSQRLLTRLGEMSAQGEQVTSLIAFVRLWAREVDAALHVAMQSEAGLAATAKAVRASLHQRAELQQLVALASAALNVPTRAEVDDAFREIQQLKREIRRLKKGPPRLDDDAEAVTNAAARRLAVAEAVATEASATEAAATEAAANEAAAGEAAPSEAAATDAATTEATAAEASATHIAATEATATKAAAKRRVSSTAPSAAAKRGAGATRSAARARNTGARK